MKKINMLFFVLSIFSTQASVKSLQDSQKTQERSFSECVIGYTGVLATISTFAYLSYWPTTESEREILINSAVYLSAFGASELARRHIIPVQKKKTRAFVDGISVSSAVFSWMQGSLVFLSAKKLNE